MAVKISIDTRSDVPIYRQICAAVEGGVKRGELRGGEMLPSMNELAATWGISRETAKKAYTMLRDRGIVEPRQGKGFFIKRREEGGKLSILVIFDKLSVYKQVLFNAFSGRLGDRAEITILMHNQSLDLLEYYLDTYLDSFDYYVVTPHFPLDSRSQKRMLKLLRRIPNRKLVVADYLPEGLEGNFGAVWQDFRRDIYDGLMQGRERFRDFSRLVTITLPGSLYGHLMCDAVREFADQAGLDAIFLEAPSEVRLGDVYLVLNSQLDWGLAELSRKASAADLVPGRDIGIISYNEFELNEVVLGGLTTVSTDFREMGFIIANMILGRDLRKVHCPFRLTSRGTF